MLKYALVLILLVFFNNFLFPFDKETYEKSIKEKIPEYYQLDNGIKLILISRERKSNLGYIQINIPLNTDRHIDRLSLSTTGVLLKKINDAGFKHKFSGKYCFDFFQNINFGLWVENSKIIETVDSIVGTFNSLNFDELINPDFISKINNSFDSTIPETQKEQCSLYREFHSTYFKDMLYINESDVSLIRKALKESVRKNNLYITVVSKLNASEIKDKISRMKLELPSIQKNYFLNKYQNFKKKKSAILIKKNSEKRISILLKSSGIEEKIKFIQEMLVLNILEILTENNSVFKKFKFTQSPFGMISINLELKNLKQNNVSSLFYELQKKFNQALEKLNKNQFARIKLSILNLYFTKRENYLGTHNVVSINSFYGKSFMDNIDKISKKKLMNTYSNIFSVMPQ